MAIATGTALALSAAAAGVGATLYGANKQAKANQSAQNANIAQQDKQNDAAWTAWLMSKGVQPTSSVTYGTMPAAGASKAVNTRLPLWANVNFSTSSPGTSGGGIRLVKKGAPRTTGITGLAPVPGATAPMTTPASRTGGPSMPGGIGFQPITAGDLYNN